MNTTTKLAAVGLALAPLALQAQFDTQLPLQYGIQQTFGNPAAMQDHKVSVALPSVTFGLFTPISLEDAGEVRDGTLFVDPDQLINRLDGNGNTPYFETTVETFGFNYRGRNWQVNVSHRIRAGGSFGLPKGLVQLAAYGNAPFVGAALQVYPNVNASAFQEFGLGGSYVVNDKLTVGGRIKYLVGAAALETVSSTATLETDPDSYASTISTDVQFATAGFPVTFSDGDADFGSIDGIAGAGSGLGIDLGATLQVNDKLQVGFSVLDLGGITWKGDAMQHVSNGSFTFTGYESDVFNDDGFEFDVEGVLDSVLDAVAFESSEASFKTSLPTRVQGTVQYDISKSTTAHATVFAANRVNWNAGFGVGVQQHVGEWLHAGMLAGVKQGGGFLGANLMFDIFGPQIYFACDNLLSATNLNGANDLFVRAGMNLAFGKVKTGKNAKGWYNTKVEGINK